jgi:DNA (cytosine-5)-methyltransferase 1
MLKQFIARQHKYAVKLLKTGASRIYIQNAELLKACGLLKNENISVTYKRNRIEVRLDPSGDQKIMDTGRGELLELKNKHVTKAIGENTFVSVTFRKGVAIIMVHGLSQRQIDREHDIIQSVIKGIPLRKACFFSGLGMLSYHLSQGLAKQGISSQIAFANDNNELAMACNLSGNPMWHTATDDATVLVDDLGEAQFMDLPTVNYVTIGYPCVGFSNLATAENRDMDHPFCGTLFIPLIAALRKMNPAVIVFENTPRFEDSDTLNAIAKEMSDYTFTSMKLDGHDFNEIESRKRVCVVAVSKGLPAFDFATLTSQFKHEPTRTVNDMLEPLPLDSERWREMAHVRARDDMKNIGYRNALYYGHETTMTTLPASYGPPKAGVPMIAHPTNPDLQRQVLPSEHANLRDLPDSLKEVVMDVWEGRHPLVSKRGSFSAAHRLLGNGVSKRIWFSMGYAFGGYLLDIALRHLDQAAPESSPQYTFNM